MVTMECYRAFDGFCIYLDRVLARRKKEIRSLTKGLSLPIYKYRRIYLVDLIYKYRIYLKIFTQGKLL